MAILKKIGVLSLGKIFLVIYGSLGFIFGAIFSFVSVLGIPVGDDPVDAVVFGAGAIIFLPIFYGLVGFLSGILTAWLYNIAAKQIGGIQLEIK